jgi:hypothetical protein
MNGKKGSTVSNTLSETPQNNRWKSFRVTSAETINFDRSGTTDFAGNDAPQPPALSGLSSAADFIMTVTGWALADRTMAASIRRRPI